MKGQKSLINSLVKVKSIKKYLNQVIQKDLILMQLSNYAMLKK